MKKKVAIIFGGEGAERHVSEKSAASLIRSIPKDTELLAIGIDEHGSWFIFLGGVEKIESSEWKSCADELKPTYPVRLAGRSGFYSEGNVIPVDLAFPVLHGDMGEDGTVQGALTCAHIPYVGSAVTPSAISADKAYTKIIAEHLGIPTAPWFIPSSDMREARKEAEMRLGYPVFIKPRRLGSSIGASGANDPREFAEAFEEAYSLSGGLVIIEAKINVARELEFALYDGKERFISGAGSIESHGETYSFEKKYVSEFSPKTEVNTGLDRKTLRLARSMARRLSDYLGLGNISRIDFFLTASGEIIFNEINSIPGLTDTSLYPKLVRSVIGEESFPAELFTSAKLQ